MQWCSLNQWPSNPSYLGTVGPSDVGCLIYIYIYEGTSSSWCSHSFLHFSPKKELWKNKLWFTVLKTWPKISLSVFCNPIPTEPKFQREVQAQICSGSVLSLGIEHDLMPGLKTKAQDARFLLQQERRAQGRCQAPRDHARRRPCLEQLGLHPATGQLSGRQWKKCSF